VIRRWRHPQVPPQLRLQMEHAARAEFQQFAIVRETRWAVPDWTCANFDGGKLAAFCHLVERTVSIDGVATRVVGLNNLVTLPAFRGRGIAASLLAHMQSDWLGSLGVECALLLCADALLPYYGRLGWRSSEAVVSYAQPDGTRTWPARCMLLTTDENHHRARSIDLCGLPW
jgi:GNAT superfamily N-acetyltransferase